jgi:hypothetical protein
VALCGVLGIFSVVEQRSLTRLALDQQLKLQYDSVVAALAATRRYHGLLVCNPASMSMPSF